MDIKEKMTKEIEIINEGNIKSKIYTIRGLQVMLDFDLSELYEVETKRLKEAVRRNIYKFPIDFMFELTKEELNILRSQIATSNSNRGGTRYTPFAFTESGVAMLSSILSSKKAIEVNIKIMRTFVEMRRFLLDNASIFQRVDNVEKKLIEYQIKTDKKLDKIFEAMEANEIKPKPGIFYDGQIFDAYSFVAELIRKAKKSIIIIDNFVDDRIFSLLSKREKDIEAIIYAKNITKELLLDLKKHNSQYAEIKIKKFNKSHDRFIILDKQEVYLFGASLKDLGNKWFGFSK
ncbi:MAG: ORF6N domain-containing protein, partial [Elusimicrobiota bacterium]|nr:ORF6N domain-containing protein [Elusimicrobiota bacterium]